MIERRRLANQGGRRKGDEFGMRAVLAEADVAAGSPHLGAQPLRRSMLHDAGKVAARHAWQRGSLHLAGDVLDVTGVHRGGHYFDHGLAGRWRRIGQLDDMKFVWAAELGELQGAHRILLLRNALRATGREGNGKAFAAFSEKKRFLRRLDRP